MIIVDQSKTIIVNVDNISIFAIDEEKTPKKIFCLDVSSREVNLGRYETEERTKEVFEQLIDNVSSLFEIYYMPKN